MSDPRLLCLHLSSALSEEGIWTFEPDDIIEDDRNAGPTLRRPLTMPQGQTRGIPAGEYVFFQWRKTDYQTVEDGFEDFIRQVWWEGEKTEGPWILRIVSEDNNTAYQGLRRIN